MTTKLGTILADFTTNLATFIPIAGTVATLQSATDDDGVVLPTGRYFFTLDGENSSKEHFSCNLSGLSLTNLKSISRQGIETVGAVRSHRIGCTVTLTDFAHIKYLNDLLAGTTKLDATTPLEYDAAPSITGSNQLATKAYVDSVAFGVGVLASTTVAGYVELATLAEVLARSTTGGSGAKLVITPDILPSTLLSDYAADTGTANTYAMAPTLAITAYVTGQIFTFKAGNANTGASTLNVSTLGAKSIKKIGNVDLAANDVVAGQIIIVQYDGTNFQMLNPVGNAPITNSNFVHSHPRGETINGSTTPVPVALINDIFQEEFGGSVTLDVGKVTTGNKMAISFTPQAAITLTSLKVYLKKQGSPTDNIVISIQSDSAGAPSGSAVTNGTGTGIAGSGLTTSFVLTTITLAGTVTLAANTKYWIVANRDSTTSDTNYFKMDGIPVAKIYAGYTGSKFDASSWTSGDLLYFQLIPVTGVSYSLFRADTDHANYHQRFFYGFVSDNGAIGVATSVTIEGVLAGFSGLTPHSIYYVQDTVGTIGLTTGTTETIVGRSVSATEILVGSRTDKPQYIGSLSLSAGANTISEWGFQSFRYFIGNFSAAATAGQLTLYRIGITSGSVSQGNGATPDFSQGVSVSYSANVVTISGGGDSVPANGATIYFYR